MRNFASFDAEKKKIKAIDGKNTSFEKYKTVSLKLGSVLSLVTTRILDTEKVFQYPLTPKPLALSDSHGNLKRTAKATLSKHIEANLSHSQPLTVYRCNFV